ncbi:MAG: class II aldolase/adducin family protein [Saccharofermentans sp.]|nr:class II aldolase/adducin family protein [Saccharofermentans sp.]
MEMNYPTDQEARELILEVGRRLYNKGFVASNDGNISCRTGEDSVWATPTGVSKGYMTEDMLVRLSLSGEVLEGKYKPSSEIKMHLRVYRENPLVGGVVHAHSPYATCAAAAEKALDGAFLTETLMGLGTVPCAHFAMPGTEEVPDSIAPYCRDYNAVLLAHHGALTWGKDLMQAYMRMESLEFYARMTLMESLIPGGYPRLTEEQIKGLEEIRRRLGN